MPALGLNAIKVCNSLHMRQTFYTCVVEPVFFALPIDNSARDAKSHVTVENNAHTYARTVVECGSHNYTLWSL